MDEQKQGFFWRYFRPDREEAGIVWANAYVGTKARLPQNVPLWHMDDFELKQLEKQLMQEGYSDTLLCPPETRQ